MRCNVRPLGPYRTARRALFSVPVVVVAVSVCVSLCDSVYFSVCVSVFLCRTEDDKLLSRQGGQISCLDRYELD